MNNGKKEGRLCISGAVGGLRYEIVMCKSHIVLYRKFPWPSREKSKHKLSRVWGVSL
jgi:hypothetical protein